MTGRDALEAKPAGLRTLIVRQSSEVWLAGKSCDGGGECQRRREREKTHCLQTGRPKASGIESRLVQRKLGDWGRKAKVPQRWFSIRNPTKEILVERA